MHVVPLLLPLSPRLAIGGALIALMSLNAEAEDGKTGAAPRRIFAGPAGHDVQSASRLPIRKTFADAIPNSDPADDPADYRMQKTRPASTCATFVELNFTLPKENDTACRPEGKLWLNISMACGRSRPAAPSRWQMGPAAAAA